MSNKSLTILLAEDDDGHAHLVQRNLKRAGVANHVVRVADGRQALDYMFRIGPYADRPTDQPLLLVLDLNMPRLDGTEVLEQLKAHPECARTPVIVLTTTDDPREVTRCYELGCSVYITKPVEYDAFIEAIRRLGLFLEVVQVPPVSAPSSIAPPLTQDDANAPAPADHTHR